MSTQEEIDLKQFIDYLSRYYTDVDVSRPHHKEVDAATLPIWQSWMQGSENAPPLVKTCFRSVVKYCEGRPIGTITLENLPGAGLDIPDYILDKYERKVIGEAHFSDILRLCLLEKYGGTWMDATVLLTGPLPQGVVSQSFFAFRAATSNIFSAHALLSNWFIHAKPNHVIVRNLKNALFRYWRHEDRALNYFIFHYMAHGMVFSNPTLTQVWFRCSQASNVPPTILRDTMTETFNKRVLDAYKRNSTVHKLTHKMGDYGVTEPPPGSFLDVFLRTPEAFEI